MSVNLVIPAYSMQYKKLINAWGSPHSSEGKHLITNLPCIVIISLINKKTERDERGKTHRRGFDVKIIESLLN